MQLNLSYLALQLQVYRYFHRMTIRALSKQCGVSPSALGRILRGGVTMPQGGTLIRLYSSTHIRPGCPRPGEMELLRFLLPVAQATTRKPGTPGFNKAIEEARSILLRHPQDAPAWIEVLEKMSK